jgi:hypothetical protein
MKKKEPQKHPFKPEELPTGKHFGALPDIIIIDGVEWKCIATATIEGNTYDKIKNTVTGEVKKVERNKFINFLQKNLHKQN